MRLLVALGVVAVLFLVSPIAGGVALGLVGALFVIGVLNRPSEIAAAQAVAKLPAAQQVQTDPLLARDAVACELCGEAIKIQAKVCRHCQAWKCDKCWEWVRAGQQCPCVPCPEGCGEDHSVRPGERCVYMEED